jgi:hypothetical protein
MAGLLVGSVLVHFAWGDDRPGSRLVITNTRPISERAVLYIVIGLVGRFVLLSLSGYIPSVGAISSNFLSIVVAGFVLQWWGYYKSGQHHKAWSTLSYFLVIPMLSVLGEGFIGYAIDALLTISAFIAVFYRPRWHLFVGGAVGCFIGISLWTAYLSSREEVRRVVWGGASFEDRLGVTMDSLSRNWVWFDMYDKRSLDAIEARLNQNGLAGLARMNIEAGLVQPAGGETLMHGILAMIPRLLWPDKPHYAGSGNLVSKYTKVQFAQGTSVGLGHVMEFYINFGETGVFIGFVLLGATLAVLDASAARALARGNLDGFLLPYVCGLALLSVLGVIAEVAPGLIGSLVLCFILRRLLGGSEVTVGDRKAPGCLPRVQP